MSQGSPIGVVSSTNVCLISTLENCFCEVPKSFDPFFGRVYLFPVNPGVFQVQ